MLKSLIPSENNNNNNNNNNNIPIIKKSEPKTQTLIANNEPVQRLDVIFGTETGSSEAIADMISEDAQKAGISEIIIHPADDVNFDDLKNMENVVLVTSTSGEGDFPPNAMEFGDRLSKATKDKVSLENTRFAVLGLGDSSYEKFCEAARFVNEKFEQLGGKRFYPYTTLDDQSDKDPEEFVNNWIQNMLKYLNLNSNDSNQIPVIKEKQTQSSSKLESKPKLQSKQKSEPITQEVPKMNTKINVNSSDSLNIIFGTETGSSEAVAEMIAKDIKKAGISEVNIYPADDVSLDDLKKMKNVICITSTSGEGEFPPNALKFWKNLSKTTKNDTSLENMRYAVLGLGDSSYEKFCEAARLINEKFEQLGGKKLHPYTTIDDQSEENPENIVNRWVQNILHELSYDDNKKANSINKNTEFEITKKTPVVSSSKPIQLLDVIFGTETGTSEAIADMISEDAKKAGIPEVIIHTADDVNLDELKKMKYVILVTSTSGEGDFPPNAMEFWNRLSKAKKETTSLNNMKYAVLGLGDSNYSKFCEAARLVNEKFEQLGGKRFHPYTTIDDQSNRDQEEMVNEWIQSMLKDLNTTDNSNNNTKYITYESKSFLASNEKEINEIEIKKCNTQTELHIIYGTQTNHSKDIAKILAFNAKNAGYPSVHIHEANTVNTEDLLKMNNIIFITPTYTGKLPTDTIEFWNKFSKMTKDEMNMSNTKYSVLGLGYNTSPRYCTAAKALNKKFQDLGSKEFYPYTEFDVEHINNPKQIINEWSGKLLNTLNNIESQEDSNSVTSKDINASSNNKNIKKCDLQAELHIIFGTKSTHAEDTAAIISMDAKDAGFPFVYVHEADTIKSEDLLKMKNIVFITSTIDGDFPPDTIELWNELSSKTKKTMDMSNIKYTILGIGNHDKKEFCAAAKKLKHQFQNLGAIEFYPYTEFDFDHSEDPEILTNSWSEKVLNTLIDNETNEIKEDVGRRKLINNNENQLNIIFGTESEHAQDVAGMLSDEAKELGLTDINIFSADRIHINDLRKMKTLIIVTSTFKGTFPPNALKFWKRLNEVDKTTAGLENLRYSVFGLGDSSKEKFCEAARLLDEKFENLGAHRFYKYTTLDKQHQEKEIEIIDQWIQEILKQINIPNKKRKFFNFLRK